LGARDHPGAGTQVVSFTPNHDGVSLVPVMEEATAPELWAGRYQVERLLGEGERKQVYLARDVVVDREVALALIEPEEPMEGGLTLTQWEVRVTAELVNHPHVVTIYDLGQHEGQTYMVSQYMRGGDLRGVLRRARADASPVPIATALRYVAETCDALAYAHAREIIHRDVQPGNVWFDEPDGSAHLGDFDLALAPGAPAELCDPEIIVTTRAYMPPEEARGEPVAAGGDLYSLGATMYELLVGRPPFEGTRAEIVEQHLNATPKPPRTLRDGLPRRLEALVLRLLAKSPADRPASAREVLDALVAMSSSMSADDTQIGELIAAGENSRVEFKSSLRYDVQAGEKNLTLQKVVAKTVAGFMNAEGGSILIGVNDSGEVVGIEHDFQTLRSKPNRDGWELAFTQAMANHLGEDAAACISLHYAEMPSGTVAVVRCTPRSKPTWVTDGETRKFFTRVGNATRPLPQAFADAYIEENWPR
jgi:serine/threonine protein kinase